MAKNNEPILDDNLEKIEETLSKTEQYIERNQKKLLIITSVIVLLIAGYWAFKNLYLEPKEVEAQNEMFIAQYYFEKDSFNLALNGDGQYFGFEKITEEYGVTKTANLAKYYAGICNLQLGNFEGAIDYLSSFSSDDKIIGAIAKGAIGDANMELGKTKEAIEFYNEAAEYNNNEVFSPYFLLKAGMACEINNENNKALEFYKKIKTDFPESTQAREIEKYISKIEAVK